MRSLRIPVFVFWLIFTVVAVWSHAAQGEPESGFDAAALVDDFHAALLASARSDADFDTRAQTFGQTFDQTFDLPRIARISAGRAWRELSPADKDNYLKLLRQVVLGAYVSRFDEDRGQSLEVLESRVVSPERFVVRAQIVRPNGKKVSLDYYIRNQKVFNVVADGVSDLAVRRADYAAIIKAEGFNGLLAHLRAQSDSARETFTDTAHRSRNRAPISGRSG